MAIQHSRLIMLKNWLIRESCQAVIIDAMGPQTVIVDIIHGNHVDYVLAVKRNSREFGRGVLFAPLPSLRIR